MYRLFPIAPRWLVTVVLLSCGCARTAPDGSRAPQEQIDPRETLVRELEHDVRALAEGIGVRDASNPQAARAAADYVQRAFESIGRVDIQAYTVDDVTHHNVALEITGSTHPEQIVVVGAHYDTAAGTPGADDNASGVAGVLALARRFARHPPPQRTIRFVAFGTEEPPYIRSPNMGSYHYARLCRERNENIVAMLSIEMIGYFSDEPASQKSLPIIGRGIPNVGNFLLFAGDISFQQLVREAAETFRGTVDLPAEEFVVPVKHLTIPLGANSSDHWSFWQFGYPAIMASDTANFRNPHYHKPTDTPDTLDYQRMATVVEGLEAVLRNWTQASD